MQIALAAGGAAARNLYLSRKERFAGDPSWAAPAEVEVRDACDRSRRTRSTAILAVEDAPEFSAKPSAENAENFRVGYVNIFSPGEMLVGICIARLARNQIDAAPRLVSRVSAVRNIRLSH